MGADGEQVDVAGNDQIGLRRHGKREHGIIVAITADWHGRGGRIDDLRQSPHLA